MLERQRDALERSLAGVNRLEAKLTFKLAMMQRLLDRQVAQILVPHGLSVTAYRVMLTIDAFGETSAAELIRTIPVDKSLMSRCCADLIARGYLGSTADPDNRRRKRLGLTAAGRAALATLTPQMQARDGAIDALFTPADLSQLHDFVNRISEHAARLPAAPVTPA